MRFVRLTASFALAAAISLTACKTVQSNAPLAPGFNNQTDAQIGETINSATVFYRTIQCERQTMNYDPTSKKCIADPQITAQLPMSATELAAFNGFGISLNALKTVYAAYHAGTATLAQAQAQASTVTNQQSALQTSIQGAAK